MPDSTKAMTTHLTPEQQELLNRYQKANEAFWQAHDAYRQALDFKNETQAACRVAGINLAEHL
jgi:hypothetical protein